MRKGLTPDEELQVRRLRFDEPLESDYRDEAARTGNRRLRAVFAVGYAVNVAVILNFMFGRTGRINLIPFLGERLLLPALPLIATAVKPLNRAIMSLTAFAWLSVLGFLIAQSWDPANLVSGLLFIGVAQILIGMCAVVLVRMPTYLVAFCGYVLFAGYVWQSRLRIAMVPKDVVGVSRPVLDQAFMTGATVLFFAMTVLVVGAYFTETIERRGYLLRRLLAEERARSEVLIANMLPAPIAERLRDHSTVIAEYHPDVTVLFADIVHFTPYAAANSPETVVGLLNRVFSKFDQLVEVAGIEKIKTVGDAYMAVGGVPIFRPDHLEATVDFGLQMIKAAAEFDVEIRVGIHSGDAMAGVIGTKKYLYDLWGSTVNTASRMESTGIPGKIQVTEAEAARLCEKYMLEERGSIEVKGIGMTRTFFVVDKKNEPRAEISARGSHST